MASTSITFLGGAREVGKNGFLVEGSDARVLLDFGLQLTEPVTFPDKPGHVDALLLSHAHLDHSGGIPYIYRKNPFALYGVDVTFDVMRLLLYDSIKVNELKGLPQKYSDADVDDVEGSEIAVHYGKERKLGGGCSATFYDAGHIPGSAGILVESDGKRIFYSGDTKMRDTLLLSGAEYPKADVLVSEATYGDRMHPGRKEAVKDFLDKAEDTCRRGGTAVVPAFAVGRSQEVLMMLDSIDYPVFLDGMAKTVTRIFLSYPEYLRDADLLQKAASNARWVEDWRTRRQVMKEPCVIVTTAGMLTGGPALHYLSKLGKNKANSVLLTGYQVEGTNGRLLLEEGYVIDAQKKKKMKVSAEVAQYDFSAHSGQKALVEMASKVSPEKIFLVHGQMECCEALSEKLSGKYDVVIPKNGDTAALD